MSKFQKEMSNWINLYNNLNEALKVRLLLL